VISVGWFACFGTLLVCFFVRLLVPPKVGGDGEGIAHAVRVSIGQVLTFLWLVLGFCFAQS
jgi:hypothetical protein